MDIKSFNKLPILGILRDVKPAFLEPLVDTIVSSGLKTIEITMNTPGAGKLIEKAVKFSKNRLTIGAGTVLTTEDLNVALDSGACFIVLPALVPEVVEHCLKKKIPVFPGALTPQEILNAWRVGATMVKVFPAKFFGPTYFKEIKGPFKDIKLLACGGVSEDNIGSFFECGASAVAFGASIFKKEWIENKKFFRMEEAIKALIKAYAKV